MNYGLATTTNLKFLRQNYKVMSQKKKEKSLILKQMQEFFEESKSYIIFENLETGKFIK